MNEKDLLEEEQTQARVQARELEVGVEAELVGAEVVVQAVQKADMSWERGGWVSWR